MDGVGCSLVTDLEKAFFEHIAGREILELRDALNSSLATIQNSPAASVARVSTPEKNND
jgi:hypothetical protein